MRGEKVPDEIWNRQPQLREDMTVEQEMAIVRID